MQKIMRLFNKTGYWVIFLILIVVCSAATRPARADVSTDNPQIITTWRSYSYSPDWYTGKNLPPPNSTILVSMDLIDKGKMADLSNYDIYWYVGDNLIASGKNKRTISVSSTSQAGDSLKIQVRLPSYKGMVLLKTISIYTTTPKAVVDIPYPINKKNSLPVAVQAWPFFFSIQNKINLSYGWQINNQTAQSQESPTILNISAPKNANLPDSLDIKLFINNPLNPSEMGSGEKILTL